jgi:hypothetical protein
LAVGLAAIDHDPLGSAMPFECRPQEPLCSSEIAPFPETELNSVAVAINGSVQIHPPPANPDICLVDVPFPTNGALAPIEALKQLG